MGNSLGSLAPFLVADEQPEVTGMQYPGTRLPVPPPTNPAARENRFRKLIGPGHGAELQALHEELAAERPAAAPMSPERKAELTRDCEKALTRLERALGRGAVPP